MKISTQKLLLILFLFMPLLTVFSCQDDDDVDMDTMVEDTEAPNFDFLKINLDEDIVEGDRFEISRSEGFRLDFNLSDDNNMVDLEAYFLVNNDPDIRSNIATVVINSTDYGVGYIFQVQRISLGNGVFYDIEIGDTFHFFITVTDEFDNEQTVTFIADIVE